MPVIVTQSDCHKYLFTATSLSNVPLLVMTAQSDALRAQIFQRLHPHAYLERFLAEGVRPDGREPREWRDVSVNVGVFSSRHSISPFSPYPFREVFDGTDYPLTDT